MPYDVIDARFTQSAQRNYENHSSNFPSERSFSDAIEERYLPRPPHRLVLEPGECVMEIFKRQVVCRKTKSKDPYTKKWIEGMNYILSGIGPYMWLGEDCGFRWSSKDFGGNCYLNSSYDHRFDSRGISQDVRKMWEELGEAPGHAVCLNKERHYARIVDLLSLSEFDEFFEKIRRSALCLSYPMVVPFPADEARIDFVDAGGRLDVGRMATFEYYMRLAFNSNYRNEREQVQYVRDRQNCQDGIRSIAELAQSGEVPLDLIMSRQAQIALKAEYALRKQQIDPDGFNWTGKLSPELAGTSETKADFQTIVINPFKV